MTHDVIVEGYIIGIEGDKIIMHAFNREQLKNIITNYGEINFVPFKGKNKVKVKAGSLPSIAKIYGKTLEEYLTDFIEVNVKITCFIRKNTRKTGDKTSTSISIIAREISAIKSISEK